MKDRPERLGVGSGEWGVGGDDVMFHNRSSSSFVQILQTDAENVHKYFIPTGIIGKGHNILLT